MYNFLIALQLFSILLFFFETGYTFLRIKNTLHSSLAMICFSTLINNIGYLLEMTSTTSEGCLYAIKFSYLGKALIPISLLVFTTELCDARIPDKILYFLLSVHVVTYLLVLTTEYHNLYYINFCFFNDGLFPTHSHDNGLWYTPYMLLLVLYMIYGITLLLRTLRHETEPVLKKRLILVILSACSQFIFFALRLCGVSPYYDLTTLGYTISGVLLFIALTKYDLMDTKFLAHQFIIDELSEAIIVTDHTKTITYMNAPAKKLFPDYANNGLSIISRIMVAYETHSKVEIDGRIYTPEITDLEYKGVSQGNVYSLIDDTDDIMTATALRKANSEAQYERQRADEANRAKSAFLSNMSHEIRTPMNAIVGITEILLRDEHSPKTAEYLRNIQRSGDSLLSLINDILDFSKIESGKLDIIDTPYDPYVMLRDLKVIFLTRVGEKSLILDYDIDDKLPHALLGDSLRIRQIIINLMNNAIKFTDNGMVRLSIAVEPLEDNQIRLNVSVKDTGQGIREEDLSKLFQSFSQVNCIQNHSKEGSGLGLAICKNLIALMGGNISVQSTFGEGSTFSFDLVQKLVTEEDVAKYNRERIAEKSFRASRAHILLVDDNEMNLTVALGLLEPLSMDIDTAVNGRDAIDKIKACHYDLVFMDHMMPVMDGLEATKELRAIDEEYYQKLPIIALSANAQKESIDAFIASGMNASVSKPIRMNEICRVLRDYLPAEYIEEVEPGEETYDSGSVPVASDHDVPFKIDGLDTAEAMLNCGNEKLLMTLLADYYRLITPKADLIDSLLRDGDIKNYTIEVHALKSTSRMIGARELAEAFKQLEEYGHNEDTISIRSIHDDVVAHYRNLKNVLRPYVEEESTPLNTVTNDEIKDVLANLCEGCAALDLDGVDQCLQYLKTLNLPARVKELMPELEALTADVALDRIPDKVSEMFKYL